MKSEQDLNKEGIIRYFIEVLQNKNVDLIPSMLAPNYTFNGQPASAKDNAGFVAYLHQEFPNFRYDILGATAQEDRVVLYWRLNAPATADRGAGYCMGANFVIGAKGLCVSNVQVSEPFTLLPA